MQWTNFIAYHWWSSQWVYPEYSGVQSVRIFLESYKLFLLGLEMIIKKDILKCDG